MPRAVRAATLIVCCVAVPGSCAQRLAGKPKAAQGREGVPGYPGFADNCQPPPAALLWIIGTSTPCNPFAAQLGSALGGLQKYPGSAFWFPVVKKNVKLLRSKNIPDPARMTVLESGE
jgi:hypothetical protein